VYLDQLASHVDEHGHGHLRDEGQLLLDEAIQPDVRQPDGVEHAGVRLDDARRRIAFARPARDALGDKAPQPIDVHEVRQLIGIAARPRRGKHRVRQPPPREIHRNVCSCSSPVFFRR
jgi:hypothetical protein